MLAGTERMKICEQTFVSFRSSSFQTFSFVPVKLWSPADSHYDKLICRNHLINWSERGLLCMFVVRNTQGVRPVLNCDNNRNPFPLFLQQIFSANLRYLRRWDEVSRNELTVSYTHEPRTSSLHAATQSATRLAQLPSSGESRWESARITTTIMAWLLFD